jgi:hypothetical protein
MQIEIGAGPGSLFAALGLVSEAVNPEIRCPGRNRASREGNGERGTVGDIDSPRRTAGLEPHAVGDLHASTGLYRSYANAT